MAVSENELLAGLELEDLQEQHREIAMAVGIKGLAALSRHFGGSSIYIPQRRELVKMKVYEMIKKEYNGSNIKELAVRYDVSESTVYNVVRELLLKGACRREAALNIPGQMTLADWQGTA